MVQQRWFLVHKKWLAVALGIIILLFGAYRGLGFFVHKSILPPEDLFDLALENTLQSHSMRFKMVVKMGKSVISDVQGQQVAPDDVHISGTMQNLPVEFIHSGGKTYIKGYWSDNWICLEGNKLAQAELFSTEFNPLGNFNFKDVPVIREIKAETVKGTKLRVLEIHPIVQNSLMELNYSDFVYTLWLDPEKQFITKARILATGKNGPRDQLEILLEMYDFNQQIVIKVPELAN